MTAHQNHVRETYEKCRGLHILNLPNLEPSAYLTNDLLFPTSFLYMHPFHV